MRCNVVTGRERIGDEFAPWHEVRCLLPAGHKGPHEDWAAWLGVERPDFSAVASFRDLERGMVSGEIPERAGSPRETPRSDITELEIEEEILRMERGE